MIFFSDDEPTVTVVLGGCEFKVTRAHLGGWIHLEQIRRKQISPETIRDYLKLCGLPDGTGLEFLRAYIMLLKLNSPKVDFPMLHGEDKKSKPIPWEYENRWAITWVHMLSKTYGWSRADVLELPIEEAFAYLQEVMVDEQLGREFVHGLSEVAYQFDKASNTSRLVPLTRPIWMNGPVSAHPQKRLKQMSKEWMPMGQVTTQEELAQLLSKTPSFS